MIFSQNAGCEMGQATSPPTGTLGRKVGDCPFPKGQGAPWSHLEIFFADAAGRVSVHSPFQDSPELESLLQDEGLFVPVTQLAFGPQNWAFSTLGLHCSSL